MPWRARCWSARRSTNPRSTRSQASSCPRPYPWNPRRETGARPAPMAAPTIDAPAVLAEGVVKRFGATVALAGVSLGIEEGTVFGLLGPNGAGKTTLVRLFTTLLRPDAGRVDVFGLDVVQEPSAVRELIGLTGQSAAVDELLTGQ